MSLLRIAVYHDLPSGGAKRALERQVAGLARLGHRLDLYVPSTAEEEFLPLAPCVESITTIERPPPPDREQALERGLSPGAVLQWLKYLSLVRRTEREAAARIDRAGHDVAFVAASQFTQAPWLLRWLRTPSIYYCQEPLRAAYEPRISPPHVRLGIRWTLGVVDRANARAADRLLVNSRFSKARVESIYDRAATVNYLGVDVERFRVLDVPRDDYVLTVAALHPLKGLDFLIDALGQVEEVHRPKLVVVSDRARDAERKRVMKGAETRGVRLELRSRVSEQELVRLYNTAALVLYAPYDEPFGFVPLEAMACGRPVLAVPEGGIAETVIEGETGFLAPREPRAFAARLTELLVDRERAEDVARKANQLVAGRWSWHRSVHELAGICAEVARNAEVAPPSSSLTANPSTAARAANSESNA